MTSVLLPHQVAVMNKEISLVDGGGKHSGSLSQLVPAVAHILVPVCELCARYYICILLAVQACLVRSALPLPRPYWGNTTDLPRSHSLNLSPKGCANSPAPSMFEYLLVGVAAKKFLMRLKSSPPGSKLLD